MNKPVEIPMQIIIPFYANWACLSLSRAVTLLKHPTNFGRYLQGNDDHEKSLTKGKTKGEGSITLKKGHTLCNFVHIF